jgi:Holliday junction DNA helicase RuvA
MIEYLKGRLIEKSPTHAVIECGGIGYYVNISLNTFSHMGDEELCQLFIHEVIREDSRSLFGFADLQERWIFKLLISVSGVGATTARMILSSLGPDEVASSILMGDVGVMKAVKGIGAKTAQRIIVDLHDKIQGGKSKEIEKVSISGNTTKSEALSALSSLGFDNTKANKTLDLILMQEGNNIALEELIKLALKQL